MALLESRNEDARKRVEEVDEEWEKMVKAADEREGELKFKLEREREKVDALEGRVDDLRAVIDKIGSGELPAGGDGSRAGTPNGHGSMVLSPTANLASRFQKSGRSFTDVYADYVRLQAELAAEKQESARLGDCLAQILADIEERVRLSLFTFIRPFDAAKFSIGTFITRTTPRIRTHSTRTCPIRPTTRRCPART